MKKIHFRVSFTLPPGATRQDARRYVKEAVACYFGCLQPQYEDGDPHAPGDPMSRLDPQSVTVRPALYERR